MLTLSHQFFAVLTAVVITYYSVPARLQKPVLLIFSLGLFVYVSGYGVFIALSIAVTAYITGRILQRRQHGRTIVFLTGLFFTFLPLVTERLFHLIRLGPGVHLVISVLGLSYFTLQAAGYLTDIYFEKYPAEESFLTLASFLLTVPMIISGPIERGDRFLPQLYTAKQFDIKLARYGWVMIFFGVLKEQAVAQRLGLIVDPVFANPQIYTATAKVIAGIIYPVRLYADFSGYSDIAVGIAALFGFRIINNFNYPFRANNIQEFWFRWHVSLSQWLQDYIFTPLSTGMRKSGVIGILIAAFLTFWFSGFWHGSTVNFLLWGFLHGCAVSCFLWFSYKKISLPPLAGKTLLMVFLWITWNVFGTVTLSSAFSLIVAPLQIFSRGAAKEISIPALILAEGSASLLLFIVAGKLNEKFGIKNKIEQLHGPFAVAVLYLMVFMLLFSELQRSGTFIYEQF